MLPETGTKDAALDRPAEKADIQSSVRPADWRPVMLTGLAFAAVATIVLVRLATYMVEPGESIGAGGDFRDAIYYPVRALLDGVNPYDPTAFLAYSPASGQWFPLYSPLHLTLHLPLAILSFEAALWLYAGLTLILTVVLAGTAVRLAGFGSSAALVLGVSALLLISNGGRANLINLQPTIIIVLAIYLTLVTRDRPWLAAFGVAVAFIKPQFGLPFVALLFLTDRAGAAWRGLVLTAATAAPVTIRLVLMEGGVGGLLGAIRRNLEFAANDTISDYQIGLARSFDLGSSTLAMAVALVFILAAVVALDGRAPTASPANLTLFTSAILLGLFHVNYDLLLLTWPALAAARVVTNGRGTRLDLALLGLFLLLFFNPFTSSFVIDQLPISDVLGALTAVTLVATFLVAARLRHQAALID
jgi:hypothetical protein